MADETPWPGTLEPRSAAEPQWPGTQIINVEGPDGSQFEFPAGTPEDVINGAIAKHYGGARDPWERPQEHDPWEREAWPGTPEDPLVTAGQMTPADRSAASTHTGVRDIMRAFGEAFGQDYEERLGLSDESKDFLARHNVLPADTNDYTNPLKPFMSFNEGIILPLAAGIEATWRLPTAVFHGLQAAGAEAGLPRDIVAMPEAFLGSPHPTGIPGRVAAEAERASQAGLGLEEYRQGVKEVPPITPAEVATARDTGVIGEPKPSINVGTPAEAAAAAIRNPLDDRPVTPPEPGVNPWWDRFDHFVGKLETTDDVKDLIRRSAEENNTFLPARQGDIPLGQVDAVADAAGVASGEIDRRGLGRMLRNDAEVRTAMQLMLQTTEDMRNAAQAVREDDSPENLIALQEKIMRRDAAVEQVVGLRAEWGRTGNVIQEFMRDVKDETALSDFLKDRDRTPDNLRTLADGLDALDRQGAARLMNDMRPSGWDKFMYYWANALISGPVTHAKYMLANAAFAGYESAVVTPIAGAVGAIRRTLSADTEGVFVGEAAARLWGMVAGTPDALVAAAKAARSGLQTPLPGELAQKIIPPQNRALPFQQKPIEGTLGTIIGLPSRGASAIHSFFNFLGYRASLEAQAYRAAAAEGLSVTDDAFWNHRQNAVNNPTAEMMNAAIDEGYRLTYINELPPALAGLTAAARKFKLFQLLMPFAHIPFNILARGLEGTPAAFLMKETRDDLAGRNGAAKQDMAIARLVAGTAVGAYVANLVVNDMMTGYGPTDQKERSQWLATGHQPYSVRIGDYWYSYQRFGSLGTMLGIFSNLGEAIPRLDSDADENVTKALTYAVHAMGKLMEDEVGMQGIAGFVSMVENPEERGDRFASQYLGSFLPYSSALRQVASAMDPEMRQAKSISDGLKYYIPGLRETLPPKRDWLGEPFTNAGYGGDLPIPGTSAVIQHRSSIGTAIAYEMQRLDLNPAIPQDRISGVKLPPMLYDRYQVISGAITRQVLNNWIRQPNWYDLPEFARREIFTKSIAIAREQARAMMMASYPQIIQAGLQQQLSRINGNKNVPKLRDIGETLH